MLFEKLKIVQCRWSSECRGEKVGEVSGICVNRDLCVIVRNLPVRQETVGHRKVVCQRLAFTTA